MARATRIALDLALVSLRKVGPVVSKMWMSAKSMVENSKARPLVCNPLVNTAEAALDKMTNMLINTLTALRDRQLPKELTYLEKELEKVKNRISKGGDSSTSKSLKPALGIAWQYAKIEMVPPMTIDFFHGPKGKQLEETVSKAADGFIANIQSRINEIEAEKQREIKRKEALAKAAQEKIKAEAKRKAEEAKKKEAEKLAKEAKDKQKTETAKKAQTEKKPEKATAVESKPKTAPPPKKPDEQAQKKAEEVKKKEAEKLAKEAKAKSEKKPEKKASAPKKPDEPKKSK